MLQPSLSRVPRVGKWQAKTFDVDFCAFLEVDLDDRHITRWFGDELASAVIDGLKVEIGQISRELDVEPQGLGGDGLVRALTIDYGQVISVK